MPTGLYSPLWIVQRELSPIIQEWANGRLVSMHPSGSYSKGTCNSSGTDMDFFISLEPETIESLEEIHNRLFNKLSGKGYSPKRQNVSINVNVSGQSVDLVPGKLQDRLASDHSLYRRRANTWTKTNVQTHITHVRNSGRLSEIRIIKLWRNQKGLDFPSFYLELSVMRALAGSPSASIATNVWKVLEFLRDSFISARIVDPANTNNVISDDLTTLEKQRISAAARVALTAQNWEEIVR
ncbi:MAG TPA: hypothetical protein VFA99_09675 [Acidobacteriaceae bacterium]|nr:hypothetical protein [Acidobacteriaceae bacterium]